MEKVIKGREGAKGGGRDGESDKGRERGGRGCVGWQGVVVCCVLYIGEGGREG